MPRLRALGRVAMLKAIQAKHVDESRILGVIEAVRKNERRWTVVDDIEREFRGEVPDKVLRAKLAAMIRRKVITGCACGCYGGFEIVGR